MPIQVLIAEDFDILREDLQQALDDQPDMRVIGAAASAAEVCELAFSCHFDILLMDIEMETMNAGILAAEHILSVKPESKIIFLTAHETDDMILTAMGTGAVDYFVKGQPEESLFAHIRAAHEGKPMLESDIQETIMQEYTRLRRSEQSLLFFINNVAQLTLTERELVKFLLQDKKVREIAEIRCVEQVTVKTQIKGLLRKFGCHRTKEITSMIRDLRITHLF